MLFDFSAQNLFSVFPEAERYPNEFRKSYRNPDDVSVAKMGDVYLADTNEIRYIFDSNGNFMYSENIMEQDEFLMGNLNANVEKDNAGNKHINDTVFEGDGAEDPDNTDIYDDPRYR